MFFGKMLDLHYICSVVMAEQGVVLSIKLCIKKVLLKLSSIVKSRKFE